MHIKGHPSIIPTAHLSLCLTRHISMIMKALSNGKQTSVIQGEKMQNNINISMLLTLVSANMQFL